MKTNLKIILMKIILYASIIFYNSYLFINHKNIIDKIFQEILVIPFLLRLTILPSIEKEKRIPSLIVSTVFWVLILMWLEKVIENTTSDPKLIFLWTIVQILLFLSIFTTGLFVSKDDKKEIKNKNLENINKT